MSRTGPRTFKATLHRREERHRYTDDVMVEEATYEFDASDAYTPTDQRALFKEYEDMAKSLGHRSVKPTSASGRFPEQIDYGDGTGQYPFPRFDRNTPLAKNEKRWLGHEVGFRYWSQFVPTANGVSAPSSELIRGTVWSLSPYLASLWVYVPDQGFYSVRERDLLTGVNAS